MGEAGVAMSSDKMSSVFEDAPEGHSAWQKVRSAISSYGNPYVIVECRQPDGTKLRSQITSNACGGSEIHARRIARLLYVKMADGASKEEVEKYKCSLVELLQHSDHKDVAVDEEQGNKKKRREAKEEIQDSKNTGDSAAEVDEEKKRKARASELEAGVAMSSDKMSSVFE